MRKLLLTLLVLTISFTGYSQIETPQPSPFAKLEQKVGLTDITLEYSRPSMRDRTIFGDLVPYGKLWRTGANANTKITFSDDVRVDGQTLEAGSYAIYTIPNEESWDVIFYTDTKNWGTPQTWDDAKVAAKIKVKSYPLPFDVQTFTLDINNLTNGGATIDLIWEKTYLGIPFTVPTDNKVLASINDVMSGTPTAKDYYAAAVYYSEENKNIERAKEWIDKAMSMTEKPAYWQLRQQSLIYAKSGNKMEAVEIAKKSLEGAKEAGNADYVKMNEDSIKEWEGM